jgi:isopenicillin N synthase-like dioxygenase
VVEEYIDHMKALSRRVDQLMARVLAQERTFFEPYFVKPLNMLRAFHYYTAEGSQAERGELGAGAHTDW